MNETLLLFSIAVGMELTLLLITMAAFSVKNAYSPNGVTLQSVQKEIDVIAQYYSFQWPKGYWSHSQKSKEIIILSMVFALSLIALLTVDTTEAINYYSVGLFAAIAALIIGLRFYYSELPSAIRTVKNWHTLIKEGVRLDPDRIEETYNKIWKECHALNLPSLGVSPDELKKRLLLLLRLSEGCQIKHIYVLWKVKQVAKTSKINSPQLVAEPEIFFSPVPWLYSSTDKKNPGDFSWAGSDTIRRTQCEKIAKEYLCHREETNIPNAVDIFSGSGRLHEITHFSLIGVDIVGEEYSLADWIKRKVEYCKSDLTVEKWKEQIGIIHQLADLIANDGNLKSDIIYGCSLLPIKELFRVGCGVWETEVLSISTVLDEDYIRIDISHHEAPNDPLIAIRVEEVTGRMTVDYPKYETLEWTISNLLLGNEFTLSSYRITTFLGVIIRVLKALTSSTVIDKNMSVAFLHWLQSRGKEEPVVLPDVLFMGFNSVETSHGVTVLTASFTDVDNEYGKMEIKEFLKKPLEDVIDKTFFGAKLGQHERNYR